MSDMCLSSSGVREHQLKSDTDRQRENSPYPPDSPIVGDSGIGELHFEFVNQISHKNPKKSRT